MNNLEVLMKNLPEGQDAAIIQSEVNRRYFTGFASSAGTLVVFADKSYFIIDSRYHEEALNVIKSAEVILQESLMEQIIELLTKHNAKKIALESEKVTLSAFAALTKDLADFTLSTSDALSQQINRQREIKSQWEIDNIDAAQKITDKTFSHIIEYIKPGLTEIDIALEMEFFSRKHGSEEPAFSFIVAAGPNSSKPHAVPSNYVVQSGDFITMDFGCTINGYRSDMTRTVAVGEPSDKQKEVYNLVLKAQKASLEGIRPGVVCGDIDAIAREIIDATEYKGLFGHGLGHAVGLDIHESPRFARGMKDIAQPGHVMTIEPGVYLPGEFGVRIEDMVVLTKDGFYNFTTSPKNLLVL